MLYNFSKYCFGRVPLILIYYVSIFIQIKYFLIDFILDS